MYFEVPRTVAPTATDVPVWPTKMSWLSLSDCSLVVAAPFSPLTLLLNSPSDVTVWIPKVPAAAASL